MNNCESVIATQVVAQLLALLLVDVIGQQPVAQLMLLGDEYE